MHRFLLAVLLTAGALSGAQSAHAATTCGGNLIGVKPLLWGDGTRLGEVQLYYNPANGRNCARVVHGGATWGKPRLTDVFIETCTRKVFNNNNRTCPQGGATPSRYWSGVVSYVTTAVSLPGQGRCVDVVGGIARRANSNVMTAARLAGFCRG